MFAIAIIRETANITLGTCCVPGNVVKTHYVCYSHALSFEVGIILTHIFQMRNVGS